MRGDERTFNVTNGTPKREGEVEPMKDEFADMLSCICGSIYLSIYLSIYGLTDARIK